MNYIYHQHNCLWWIAGFAICFSVFIQIVSLVSLAVAGFSLSMFIYYRVIFITAFIYFGPFGLMAMLSMLFPYSQFNSASNWLKNQVQFHCFSCIYIYLMRMGRMYWTTLFCHCRDSSFRLSEMDDFRLIHSINGWTLKHFFLTKTHCNW